MLTSPQPSRSALSLFTLAAASFIPLTGAMAVQSRWGQKAAYVPTQQSIYFIGGQVSAWNGSLTDVPTPSITNEILVLNLTTDDPSFTTGISSDLPPTAFHTVAYAEKTHQLVSFGGLTSSCSGDALVHTFDLEGASSWRSVGVQDLVRRRGMGSGYSVKDQEMIVVGGLADEYVCAASTYSYPAYDLLSLPMSSATSARTSGFPYASLNSNPLLGVIDFSLTRLANDSFLLAGGADASGSLVSFDNVGVWDSTDGWRVLETHGDIPAPRAGHNMLAHPALDMLVLHGGATSTANLSSTASTTLAFLNTTTMTWSQPRNLQPPTSFARAWHSSIMVDSGVLVTAFGLSAEGHPRSDIVYLDMRSNDASKWTWKAVWSAAMLDASLAYSPITSSNESAPSGKTLKSVLIPCLVVLVLGIPLAVWLLRRHVRSVRHRRMAQHFEMDPEDEHKAGPTTALGQFLASKFGKSVSGGARPTLSAPFGGVRINEKGEVVTKDESIVVSQLKGIFKRFSSSSFASFGSVESTAQDKEMAEIRVGVAGITASRAAASGTGKPHQWEEIDFGLGKVDESRRGSVVPRSSASFDDSRRSSESRRSFGTRNEAKLIDIPQVSFEGPFGDEFRVDDEKPAATSSHLSPPALVILPPSQPNTPSIGANSDPAGFNFTGSSTFVDTSADPAIALHREVATEQMKDEWKSLADSLISHPVFGTSSPSSATEPLSRTAHDDLASPVDLHPMTVLPPLAFQQRRTSGSGIPDSSKYPGLRISTISGESESPLYKRNSASSGFSAPTARCVSQPMQSSGRDLTSPLSTGRRSGDYADLRAEAKAKAAHRVSASGIYDKFRSPYVESSSSRPVSSFSAESPSSLTSPINPTQRYSTPPLFPPPVSPPPTAPVEDEMPYNRRGIERYPSGRESVESKLRVVNITSDSEVD
ncbi:hypothetical protein NliqN6_3629 [Naganishia liquefaciens]|uniref:Galactose oxidase n=1 Tax=Naganishia liquefaciens TaxID=104408 RepID=A0A8H3TU57_9TREE|nr:hypothetical protein NliqN6_3629 [Naganishia liquefaciens]